MKKIPVLYDILIVYVDILYGKHQYKGVSLVGIFQVLPSLGVLITCDCPSLIPLNI